MGLGASEAATRVHVPASQGRSTGRTPTRYCNRFVASCREFLT